MKKTVFGLALGVVLSLGMLTGLFSVQVTWHLSHSMLSCVQILNAALSGQDIRAVVAMANLAWAFVFGVHFGVTSWLLMELLFRRRRQGKQGEIGTLTNGPKVRPNHLKTHE